MDDFLAFLAIIGAILVAFIAVVVGLSWANAEWNCSNYPAETKVMAATCYVKDGDKWVTFDSYVKAYNVNVN